MPKGGIVAAIADRAEPLTPAIIDGILTAWRHRRPDDGVALARRWLGAKQDGLLDDDDVAVLMAVRVGDARVPDAAERLARLVRAGWCLPEP
jgi:hypothetical protein